MTVVEEFEPIAQVINVVIEQGDDFLMPVTITEGGIAYVWTGATPTCRIFDKADIGTEPASLVAVTPTTGSGGSLILSCDNGLITGVLLPGVNYYYIVKIEKAGASRTFIKGDFRIRPT